MTRLRDETASARQGVRDAERPRVRGPELRRDKAKAARLKSNAAATCAKTTAKASTATELSPELGVALFGLLAISLFFPACKKVGRS
jgi:hypothetical protein